MCLFQKLRVEAKLKPTLVYLHKFLSVFILYCDAFVLLLNSSHPEPFPSLGIREICLCELAGPPFGRLADKLGACSLSATL